MKDTELVKRLQDILDGQVENGEECGCQLAIFRDGVPVADLAAGWADPARTRKITPDSLFPVFSCGKGLLSTAFHMLCERGLDTSRVRLLGLPDRFIEHASRSIQLVEAGLDATHFVATMKDLVRHPADHTARRML